MHRDENDKNDDDDDGDALALFPLNLLMSIFGGDEKRGGGGGGSSSIDRRVDVDAAAGLMRRVDS